MYALLLLVLENTAALFAAVSVIVDLAMAGTYLLSHRYAVKLLYDEASLGEIQDDSELAKCLESYDDDWFIGSETELKWEEAIRSKKSHLFSLGRDLEKVRKYFSS